MATEDLVDVDIYLTNPQPKWRLVVDRSKAARFGVDLRDLVATLNGGVGYQDASWFHGQGAKYPVPIRIELAPVTNGIWRACWRSRCAARAGSWCGSPSW